MGRGVSPLVGRVTALLPVAIGCTVATIARWGFAAIIFASITLLPGPGLDQVKFDVSHLRCSVLTQTAQPTIGARISLTPVFHASLEQKALDEH